MLAYFSRKIARCSSFSFSRESPTLAARTCLDFSPPIFRMLSALQASMAKLLSSDIAVAVTQEGQLVHGGWGYAEEFAISRHVVDALVLPIFEGVKPILELKVIARALLGER